MSVPIAVMLTPDAFCQAFGARSMLARQLQHLGAANVLVVDEPHAADLALLHINPAQLQQCLSATPKLARCIRVACPTNARQLHQLKAARADGFDAVFVHSMAHWQLAQALPIPTFWTQTGCVTPPVDGSELGPMWRTRLGLSASGCVVLAVDDVPGATDSQALRCAQRAFAYARLRDTALALVVWERDASMLTWRAEAGGVVRLRGQMPEQHVQRLFAASDVFVRTHAGCNADMAYAMQAGVLCIAAEDRQQSGLATPYNSITLDASQITDGIMHVHRDALERQLVRATGLVKAGTRLTLTRQAQRDVQCLQGAMPKRMLHYALRRSLQNAHASHASHA